MNLDSSHTAIPMAVAHRLFACYYGTGPRHDGSVPASEVNPSSDEAIATGIPTPSTGGVDPQQGHEGEFFNAGAVSVNANAAPPGWVAKGYGAPRPKTPTPPA